MKKTVFYLAIYFTVLVLSFGKAHSQSIANIGILPVYNHQSNNIFFIDCDAGEIKSFAILDEPIWGLNLNEDKNTFFAQSRHSIYKGNLETGEILEKFQYMEIMKQQKENDIDPNLNIMPYGVTKDGLAAYVYNSELFELNVQQQELLEKMEGASIEEVNNLSKNIDKLTNKILLLNKTSEVYLADFNSKSKKLYGKFHMDEEQFIGLDEDMAMFYDKSNYSIKLIDMNSQKVVKERSASGLFEQYPELKNLPHSAPAVLSENLLSFTFFDPTVLTGGGVFILFNTETNQPLYYKEYESATTSTYPLYYKNTTNYFFADKTCDAGPMPTPPDFGEPSGYSKKKIAAWEEEMEKKQNEHQKALKEWQDKATNPENCSITIFEDDELEEVKMEIPNASFAMIYNDIYAIVNRNFEIVLYNLESKEQEWVIDTNF